MCDPVKRPLTWDKKYYVYAERHGLYDVIQNLMKELAIWRPDDPIHYIKDEIQRIGNSVYAPKVFMIGPEPLAPLLAEGISNHCGAKFFTVRSIIQSTTMDIRALLSSFMNGEDTDDEYQRKLLIATIARRLVNPDCIKAGYVLYGFPQSRAQAAMAQASGLIPKQVFVLMPQGPADPKRPLVPGTASTIAASSAIFTDIFSAEKLKTKYTANDLYLHKDYFGMKDTASAYTSEILRVKSYDSWKRTDPHDLEAEFLGVLITKPSSGAPWIPRILIIGPPGAGKKTVAERLAAHYRVAAFSWNDIVRGALTCEDDHSDACRMYLDNFTPLSDECVTALLTRRLFRDDCLKKGFILYGFPETANQAAVLENIALSPNRIFLLSCPEEVAKRRVAKKTMEIMSRRTPDHPLFYQKKEMEGEEDDLHADAGPLETFCQNPYSREAIMARFEYYNDNLPGVLRHYGSSVIYVDGSEDFEVVLDFVYACALRPPNIRFD